MKTLIIKRPSNSHHSTSYPEDILRIVDLIGSHGYSCSRSEACEIWELVSEDYCAGWLILPKDDADLWGMLKRRIVLYDEFVEDALESEVIRKLGNEEIIRRLSNENEN